MRCMVVLFTREEIASEGKPEGKTVFEYFRSKYKINRVIVQVVYAVYWLEGTSNYQATTSAILQSPSKITAIIWPKLLFHTSLSGELCRSLGSLDTQ